MKITICFFALSCCLVLLGCATDAREDTSRSSIGNMSAMAGDQKSSAEKGSANAQITRQVMQTRRLPNGDPLPTASNPGNYQPPGH